MSSPRLASDYLQDILDAMVKAEEFITGLHYDAFQRDDKTVFAVVRALEIIGEATKKIPASVRRRHSDVPWKNLAGMRDKLIHDYMGISLETVWRTVTEDIPAVRQQIADILATVKASEADSGG